MRTYSELKDDFITSVRSELKAGLAQCTAKQQHFFKRMYAGGNLERPIDAVVDHMPEDDLFCAMGQVQRTLNRKEDKT